MSVALASGTAYAGSIKGKVECKGVPDNRDAVVYLTNVPGTFAPHGNSPSIDQFRMEFIPQVLPILVGTTVRILNSDPSMHNVYTPSKAGDYFNLGTWGQGQAKMYTFKKPGEVHLLCNVHPEMEAWILVLPNPHFAKTGPDGRYALRNVPPGTYALSVWHRKLKFAPVEIQVPATSDAVANPASQ
jgi:plastocyanin